MFLCLLLTSPSQGNIGPRAPWGGEIGGAGVDHFGSPGTALARTLTDLGSQEKLTDTQVESIRYGTCVPLTHWLTDSLTHCITDSLIRCPTDSLTDSLIQ